MTIKFVISAYRQKIQIFLSKSFPLRFRLPTGRQGEANTPYHFFLSPAFGEGEEVPQGQVRVLGEVRNLVNLRISQTSP